MKLYWVKMGKKQYFAAICGIKNSGKTTLAEGIVRTLTGRGLKTAVIKHDGHEFECDIPGTDSDRFVRAGAYGAAVFSKGRIFVHKTGSFPGNDDASGARMILARLTSAFPEADVILFEGFKGLPLPKIEVVRSSVSREPASNPVGRFLIVSDLPQERIGEKTLPFDDLESIVDAILENGNIENRKITERMKETGAIEKTLADPANEAGNLDYRRSQENGRPCKMTGQDFTHFDESGRARMVNVGDKEITKRTAVAEGRVLLNPHTFELIKSGGMKKGDVLATAQIAGIMGAKRTPDLIPMCHPLFLSGIRLDLHLNEKDHSVEIRATVSCEGKTGVEMEALTAVSTAALTVYDMCKAVQRDMQITDIRLVQKTGGVHGDYTVD